MGDPRDEDIEQGADLQPKTHPGNTIDEKETPVDALQPNTDEEMDSGYEPQPISLPSDNLAQEEHEALNDMVRVFLRDRNAVAVQTTYSLLGRNTQAYLSSFGMERLCWERP